MDNKTKELIALGASVSAHCFPCLDFHLKEARNLGAAEQEIQEAIQIGVSVMNGAGKKMLEKIAVTVPNNTVKGTECCTNS